MIYLESQDLTWSLKIYLESPCVFCFFFFIGSMTPFCKGQKETPDCLGLRRFPAPAPNIYIYIYFYLFSYLFI